MAATTNTKQRSATGSSPANDALGAVDERGERVPVVGEVHRIEVDRRALQVVEILERDVADDEHGGRPDVQV